MSNVVKLSLAVVLALAAAGLNAAWLTAKKHPPTYVAAAVDLMKPGTVITDQMLTGVEIPGDAANLSKTFIPYVSRPTLLGLKTTRPFIQGDVFLQTDIQAPRELAEYEVLGPFKLIGVGSRFTQTATNKDESQLDASGNVITLAVNANFDERTRRLLQVIQTKQAGRSVIVAIQVVPKEEQKAVPPIEDKNVVYQTISLDGITNVPRVLLEGDVIRFVIPAHSL